MKKTAMTLIAAIAIVGAAAGQDMITGPAPIPTNWNFKLVADNVAILTGTNAPIDETRSETTEEQVQRLAAFGKICKVFGHWWELDWSYIRPPRRTCKLCKLTQVQETWWKDVEEGGQ